MIHATALVHPGAKLAPGVSVGAYSVVGEHVEVGEATWIGAHVVIEGRTRIGRGNRIFPFVALGGPPQDMKYAGEPTRLEIGDRNTIREFGTFNTGTVQDEGVTRVGSDNWVMAYAHVAHDCRIGDHTILANNAQLAGHVHLGDWAIIGGMSGVHQFVKIGPHAMIGGGAILLQDVPPFVMCSGNPAKPFGINAEGLKRRGYSPEAIAAIRRAYKIIYRSGLTVEDARAELARQRESTPELGMLDDFLAAATRGIIR
ncbi:MAG: acyl-ACP--UDP-N-acetylglucosamine O-acyltransferase [Burkholderiales bacterium]